MRRNVLRPKGRTSRLFSNLTESVLSRRAVERTHPYSPTPGTGFFLVGRLASNMWGSQTESGQKPVSELADIPCRQRAGAGVAQGIGAGEAISGW